MRESADLRLRHMRRQQHLLRRHNLSEQRYLCRFADMSSHVDLRWLLYLREQPDMFADNLRRPKHLPRQFDMSGRSDLSEYQHLRWYEHLSRSAHVCAHN